MTERYLGLHRADGSPVLVLSSMDFDNDPYTVSDVDLGAIGVREEVEDNPTGSGTTDTTALTGAAGVSVALTVGDGQGYRSGYWYDRLREALLPRHRYFLHIRERQWPEVRRIAVVGRDMPRNMTARYPSFTVQWKAPDGYLEDLTPTEVRLRPLSTTSGEGLAAPVSAPVFAPPADSADQPPLNVGGQAETPWEADIYGDCRGAPSLVHESAGWRFVGKSTLVIPPGHFVRVLPFGPTGPRVLYDGDPAQDLYGLVDWARSSMRPFLPGENKLTLSASAYSTGFEARVRWRRRWA